MLASDLQEHLDTLDRETLSVKAKLDNLHQQITNLRSGLMASSDPFSEDLGIESVILQKNALLLLRKSGSASMAVSGLYRTIESFVSSIPGARDSLGEQETKTFFIAIGKGIRKLFKTIWLSRKIITG